MSETLRDLVVSLSLNSDNFTRNVKSINRQIQEAQSAFKLAAAGVEGFEQTTTGLSSKLSTLQRTMKLQTDAVDQYQKALAQTSAKLQECYDRQNDYSARLDVARQRHASLKQTVADAAADYRSYSASLGEADAATIAAKAHLDQVKEAYRNSAQEVKKLQGQKVVLTQATQNAADAFSIAQTKLNGAKAAVKTTAAEITTCSAALALSRTSWDAAGNTIRQTQQAVASIGLKMQEAESRFRLAGAGVRDFDSSTAGLTAKLQLLQERQSLQNQAVSEYATRLQAAKEQLGAAQSVNDPEKIRQATDAVTAAQTALNSAQAAVRNTAMEITDCNQALALSRTNWFSAGDAIRQSQAAVVSISAQMQLAESRFKLASAGVKDFDTSTAGLTAKLTLLQEKLTLQTQAVSEYEKQLWSAKDQLQAAQVVNDPEKIRQATDAVTQAEAALNHAQAAVRETTAEIDDCNDALLLSMTNWDAAGEKIRQSEQAVVSLGKQIKLAESQFKLASAGIKDLDKSAEGLTAKLTMLQEKLALQNEEVAEYEKQLEAAKERLQAAQDAHAPEKIRKATDAVIDAEAALNNAKAAVKQTQVDIEDCNKALKTAQSAWTDAGESMESFAKKCDKTGKALTKAGKTLTMTISTPIVGLGTAAVKASIDFESSFASVRKTVDATEAEFDTLAAASKKMSTQIAASTDEINEVMATGGQLGIANAYLESFARTMIDLGNSCEDLNADEAATSIAKFANVMGTNQSMFQNIGSTIVDLGNNFATTEKPIMEMAQRLAGAGKQVGLTEAQVLGFAAALSSVGIEAQMGGTAFSKALINMEVACATGGDALEDFGKVCGMSGKQFKALFESDPAAAFEAFITGLAKLDEEGESAIAVLNEIGIKEVRLRDTLLRSVNATELFARAQQTANRAWEENTALTNEANKRYATTESKLKNLKNTALLFGQQIGDDLNPTIQKLIQGAENLLQKFLAMDESQRKQIIQYAAVAAAAGPVILTFGKLSKGLGTVVGGFGKFATAVGKAGGGFKGFMSVIGKSPSVWLAVAAAVVVGTVALVDFVSGAKAAREALKGMEETAKSWKETAAETFYSESKGLSFFGMNREDFARETKSAQDWVTGLIAVWTDGKKETNDIVTQWTDSFKALTASMRTELQKLQNTADASGYTGVSAQIQKDIDSLDAMDKEISALLKRRQNGYFSEKDKLRLQELIDVREAIEIKYNLSPADTDGFDTIVSKVQAEVARAQARGATDASVEVYENALVACAEGMAAVNAQIDAQYDREYAIVQLIEDEKERKAAQVALDARYREQRLAGAQEYAAAMAEVITPVWEQQNIRQAATDVDRLTQLLRAYSALDMEGKKGMLGELNELTASMDEASLVEYVGLLTQIQSLMDSGMSEADIQAMFPEIDFSTALDQLASIQQYLNENSWDPNLKSIDEMFGDALPEEIVKLSTDLDMTGAQARWDEFAANPGAITTDAIISGYQDAEDAKLLQPTVDAFIAAYTEVPEGADTSSLTPTGLLAYVTKYAEVVTGADVSALTPSQITAMVSAYKELAEGTDVSTLKPSEITAYISKYLEANGVDTTGITPEGLTAFVLAYEEITGGALTTALNPTDIAAIVTQYLLDENVNMSAITEPQLDAMVTAYAEATGCDKSALKAEVVAQITEYIVAEGVTTPTIRAKVGLTGYDTLAYRKFILQNPVEVVGVVRLSEIYENPTDALQDSGTKYYDKNGVEVPVTAVPQEALTADSVAVLSDDGTIHILVTPEISGTEEAIAEMRTVVDEVDQLGVTAVGQAFGILPATLMDFVDAALGRIETFKDPGFFDFAWLTDMIDSTARLRTLDFSMQSDFNAENIAELSTYVAEVVKAIQNGEEVSEEDIANLQNVLTLISELDTLDIGDNVIQGIAQGMTDAGWDSDAETVVGNLEAAINTALDAHSPAQRMVPIGENAAAGIAQGASEYDFTADAETIASAMQTALETAFSGSDEGSGKAQSIGETLASGIGNGAAGYDFSADAAATALTMEAALNTAFTGTKESGGKALGEAAAMQIASGMSGYDFSSSAESVKSNTASAIGAVMTASTLTAYGQTAALGLANALSDYSFSGAGSAIGNHVHSTVSANLTASTLRSAGVNVMNGLTAGIHAGRSGVISAMRSAARAAVNAAKSELKIKSPSGVFRDEVGKMTMKGFGEGVLEESKKQQRILRNATRFLTDSAKEGAIAYSSQDNRRINNNTNQSVNLNIQSMQIRDEQDIRSLAIEIATLTKRQQRGKGLRFA